MAGAIVVPLNLMLTPEEILLILRDCRPRLVLVHPAIASRLNLSALGEGAGADLLRALVVTGEDVLNGIAALSSENAVPADAGSRVDLPQIPARPRFSGKPPRPVVVADDTPCAILYTSRTTGRPKGAVLSHKNLLANVRQLDDASNLGPDDKFLCVLPMFHSFGWTVCVRSGI